MKIGYILSICTAVDGRSNGVRSQAETWAEQLRYLGHEIDFINPTGNYDWKNFDLIHFFGYGTWLYVAEQIKNKTTAKLVLSPIIDTNRNVELCRMASLFSIPRAHLESPWSALRRASKHFSHFYARSDHELRYIRHALNIESRRISKLHLGYRDVGIQLKQIDNRENFCLHVSILSGAHKNVLRLIEAAIKYKFDLVLAGSFGSEAFKKKVLDVCAVHKNIKALGFVSDDVLFNLFAKAKVFALPSTFEGVGLVALEAAAKGCEVVITDRGGPKEYYANLAYEVNPFDVDAIGSTIKRALREAPMYQPQLMNHVIESFNSKKLGNELEESYKRIISGDATNGKINGVHG